MSSHFKLSRFGHKVDVGKADGYYHSINGNVCFVSKKFSKMLGSTCLSYDLSSSEITLLEKLEDLGLIVRSDRNENTVIGELQKTFLGKPNFGILYLLLTDRCNFACKYCFIKKGMPKGYKYHDMTFPVMKKAIDLFVYCLANNPSDRPLEDIQVIFYGGEPLLNTETLRYALEYLEKQKGKGNLPKELQIIMNTNGSLITPDIARLLVSHRVHIAISLDGDQLINDSQRTYPDGRGTFQDVLLGYRLLKEAGGFAGISCTIGNHNLGHIGSVTEWMVEKLEIDSFGLNLMMETAIPFSRPYAIKSSKDMIEAFKIARERGVYEDQIMRKVNCFVDQRIYPTDCGACGNQLVVAPDGSLGVCHAFVGERKFFPGSVRMPEFNPFKDPTFVEWSWRSPLNMSQCYDCIALGICGGGCPNNSYNAKGSIWALDEGFCIHSKMTVEWLIKDLFEITSKRSKKRTLL